ncbi:DUF2272 domain-containing protein [Ramlibacter sp. G-1-2-2]|uniref:DUF2272 domain-containing protein n=1 Tax=Ramlibacter agri TaxID=2728837 RepID=A0A848HDM8_9BURK|nr:DUF2272 domain-containing protein [Ramlibacter agri]NML47461.1 DUF2272 domain-containing protein [Ramlibacter agri]
MMCSLPGWLAAALLCAGFSSPSVAASACAATARHAPTDPRLQAAVAEARRQHQLFGGQAIARDGGMYRVGHYEAEWDRAPGESMATWQRVAAFWQSLSDADPPDLITSAGLVARSEALRAVPEASVAIRESLLRAAIVDTPWSAAFISHVMKTAGFARTEFAFSDSHADYVQAAFAAGAEEAAGRPASYAFRACDVTTTTPRAGDLLCATRANTADVKRFDALAAALAARAPGQPFPMHCDLVVRSDAGGDAKVETIGGNVIQSVTLSRMTLNANKVLGAAYFTRPGPQREHLGRRPWVVVLQARQ